MEAKQQNFFEKMGVWSVTGLVAIVVVAYSLWGASVLRAQDHTAAFSQAQTQTASSALSANL